MGANMRNIALGCAVAIVLAGCATTSAGDPVQIGRDTYMIDASGPGRAKLETEAAREAATFCERKGLKLTVQHTSSSGVTGLGPRSVNVVFRCLSESDPEYQRLQYHADPNVVIEDKR